MEAIVLAGGFGTRLSNIVSNVPKPMASINGQPFLKYIFDYLLKNKVTFAVLAVGYKAEVVYKYFGYNYQNLKIEYSVETAPLGTGGAIKKALSLCSKEDVLIINGDTYFDVDINNMLAFHINKGSCLTMAVKPMINFSRYGSVVVENDMIKRFEEKKPTLKGKINGGTYIIKKKILEVIDKETFSFEKSVLESKLFDIYAYESDGYFIDIGIPEDYYKAQEDFKNI